MQKPVPLLMGLFHGTVRRRYIRSLYRFERTAKKLGVEENLVYDAYINRFFSSMTSAQFCRCLLDGKLDKAHLRAWSVGSFM